MRYLFGSLCLILGACNAPLKPAAVSIPLNDQPQRIVSLDYCADQYVLKLADPERIAAISPDAVKAFSYMRDAAKAHKTVRASAEDILLLKPDLIVRAYGGGPNAAALFESAGIPVLNVGWAGDLNGISQVTRDMAIGLGVPQRGEELVTEMETRLAAVKAKTTARKDARSQALYMTPTGVTAGPGSLVDEILDVAGIDNFETKSGWHSLPLERLIFEQPDMVAAAFFDDENSHKGAWSAMRHPIARAQMEGLTDVQLKGAWMTCSGWFLMDAIEELAEGATTDAQIAEPL
ncbi:MAG: ABC transporter substrate-binding protein [Maricaulaceae bacterium]